MTKKPQVKCPICEQRFYREDVPDFVESGKRFYHPDCYQEKLKRDFHKEQHKAAKRTYTEEEQEWVYKIQGKAQTECGESYNPQLVGRQIKKFLQNGKSLEKIYKALEYWYDVQKNDGSKAKGGIGIVDWIYEDSNKYWIQQAQQNNKYKNLKRDELTKRSKELKSEKRKCGTRYKVQQPRRVSYFNLD